MSNITSPFSTEHSVTVRLIAGNGILSAAFLFAFVVLLSLSFAGISLGSMLFFSVYSQCLFSFLFFTGTWLLPSALPYSGRLRFLSFSALLLSPFLSWGWQFSSSLYFSACATLYLLLVCESLRIWLTQSYHVHGKRSPSSRFRVTFHVLHYWFVFLAVIAPFYARLAALLLLFATEDHSTLPPDSSFLFNFRIFFYLNLFFMDSLQWLLIPVSALLGLLACVFHILDVLIQLLKTVQQTVTSEMATNQAEPLPQPAQEQCETLHSNSEDN